MIKFWITACLNNRLLVGIFMVGITLSGIWAMKTIPIDAVPDLSDTQVIIYTPWEGRDPQTIEDQVTYPINTAMLSVPKVRDVRGFSFFGFSLVYIIFDDGTDIYWARSRTLEYLNQVQSQLPKGVSPNLGPDATGLGWVFMYTVEDTSGKYNISDMRALQDWYIRYQLMSVNGVAEVATMGGAVRQYQVTIDPTKLALYHIPIRKIIKAIRESNNDVGGKVIELSETEYMVRGSGYIKSIQDIEKTVISVSEEGTPILLRDLGEVALGPDIKRGVADKNGEGEVVSGIVVMRYQENAQEVIDGVKRKIKEISTGLPEGIVINAAYDRSTLIQKAIGTLQKQLIEEMLVVALVCILFLWHLASSLVAAITIPVGVISSFILMKLFGVNANIMSLGGIAIAIGAMVDAATVFVENAHKHLEKKTTQSHLDTIKQASIEVGPSLFFSLLIITVSFLPVFTLEEQAGRLFKPLAFTKTFAMGMSAFFSVTLIPVLMFYFVRGNIKKESENPVSRLLIKIYLPAIHFVLKRKKKVIIATGIILLLTLFPYLQLGNEFMPPLQEGDILYMPTTVPGLSITEARRALQTQDKILATFPEVKVVLGKIGRSTSPTDPAPLSMVETTITLKDEKQWPKRYIPEGKLYYAVTGLYKKVKKAKLLESALKNKKNFFHEVSSKSRWSVNQWIRLEIINGKSLKEIKKELPGQIAHQIMAQLAQGLKNDNLLIDNPMLTSELSKIAHDYKKNIKKIRLKKVTFDILTKEEMNKEIQIPGMPNWWLQPIETRMGMVTTGMRGAVGLKLMGTDLVTLQKVALEIEQTLKQVPGTSSVIAERAMGGYYLDIKILRDECARYGLSVADVQDVIETAIGGKNIATTVEGRYRFPINLRYPREQRDDPEKLKRVLVFTQQGNHVPLQQVANIVLKEGPPMIKSENGLLLTTIPVDLEKGLDIGTYVKRANVALDQAIKEKRLNLPAGYYMKWSGQFEFMQSVNKKLQVIIPVTLFIIFILLYLNFGSLVPALIVMLSLPFAIVGGVWMMWLLGYNLSVAAGVGFIALAGLAAETGVIMLVYLDLAYNKVKAQGQLTAQKIKDAVIEGAVMRVRPKMMTVMTTIIGLLPIMWSLGVGSRPLKRMATPMIGGLISSTILTLIVIPVIYVLIKEWQLKHDKKNKQKDFGGQSL